jgi:hypothetical protein
MDFLIPTSRPPGGGRAIADDLCLRPGGPDVNRNPVAQSGRVQGGSDSRGAGRSKRVPLERLRTDLDGPEIVRALKTVHGSPLVTRDRRMRRSKRVPLALD